MVKSGNVSDNKGTIYNNTLNSMWDYTDNMLIFMWDNDCIVSSSFLCGTIQKKNSFLCGTIQKNTLIFMWDNT